MNAVAYPAVISAAIDDDKYRASPVATRANAMTSMQFVAAVMVAVVVFAQVVAAAVTVTLADCETDCHHHHSDYYHSVDDFLSPLISSVSVSAAVSTSILAFDENYEHYQSFQMMEVHHHHRHPHHLRRLHPHHLWDCVHYHGDYVIDLIDDYHYLHLRPDFDCDSDSDFD